jgi:hypothetical protein
MSERRKTFRKTSGMGKTEILTEIDPAPDRSDEKIDPLALLPRRIIIDPLKNSSTPTR